MSVFVCVGVLCSGFSLCTVDDIAVCDGVLVLVGV